MELKKNSEFCFAFSFVKPKILKKLPWSANMRRTHPYVACLCT